MDELAQHLARRAKALGLSSADVQDTDPEQLCAFAEVVLEELAARGYLAGQEEIDCWAAPRSSGN